MATLTELPKSDGKFSEPYESMYQEFKERLMNELVIGVEGSDELLRYGRNRSAYKDRSLLVLTDRGEK